MFKKEMCVSGDHWKTDISAKEVLRTFEGEHKTIRSYRYGQLKLGFLS